ncbi:hypothetical protein B9Z19DRAFT_1120391 [Tuber borchii]|uniref:Uncharacterized protein n=1 Tax=Tuber borchii TaxID=42251 RepID=A0A2T7A4G4_TUBBO|nr:hypothetical protein B9Z19DRAFT_1120391 [Tuber borchii]
MTMVVVALVRNMMTNEESVHPANFGGSLSESDDRISNSSVRSIGRAGHIIMLDGGSEVSTDSEDGEVFDDEESGMEEEAA